MANRGICLQQNRIDINRGVSMSAYVSEKLSIDYSVPIGLIHLLAGVTNKPQKEIWCVMSEVANVCANRLLKKPNQRHSWTSKTFPGTEVELRIDMRKHTEYTSKKETFSCEVKFGKTKFEKFTQLQVNEYITESILLGIE